MPKPALKKLTGRSTRSWLIAWSFSYKQKVAQTVHYLGIVTNKDIADLNLWAEAKTAYTQLVFNFPNFEIAETFFNSVFSDIHDHSKISDDIIYVLSSQLIEAPEAEYSIFIRYEGDDFCAMFRRILKESEFSLPGEDIELRPRLYYGGLQSRGIAATQKQCKERQYKEQLG